MAYRYSKVRQIDRRIREGHSTAIAALEYDEENQIMIIHFQQRGSYRYYDVPPDVFQDFNTAGLQGSFFNLYVRPVYTNYERIG